MSHYDYEQSRHLAIVDVPFAALIMAAYRKADTENAAKLKMMWPDIIAELQQRYNAPGGYLEGEGSF